MTREKFFNAIGFSLLIICFIVSLGRIALAKIKSNSETEHGKNVTIRVAHWQLEGGVREALDVIAQKYTELHPNVRIMQIPIPERIFTNWFTTQLAGGTPPDIIELGFGNTPERMARYFVPLTDIVSEPNPYNKGTPLETVAFRDTFFDGMEGGFDEVLLEYYGVPISSVATRIFYNLDLLKKITGSEKLPKTFEEFQALCEQVLAYSKKTGQSIYPLAGSKSTGPRLLNYLFESQTQRLVQENINQAGTITSSPLPADLANAYWEGGWSMQSPSVRGGLELMRAFGKYMQPGFMQLGRDDATFYFAQGRAVMICTGTWDPTSLRKVAPFPIGASIVPIPDTKNATFGNFTYGSISEASQNASLKFGLTKASPNRAVAEDFLRFLASAPINKVWTDVSQWPPAIVDVDPPEAARVFLPVIDGYMPGFALAKPGADTKRVFENNIHRLFTADGGVDAYIDLIEVPYNSALQSDMSRVLRTGQDNLRRADSIAGALGFLSATSATNTAAKSAVEKRKLDLLLQAMVSNERALYRNAEALRHSKTKKP